MTDIIINEINQNIFKPPINRLVHNQGDSDDWSFSINQDISLWDIRAELFTNLVDVPPSGTIQSRRYASVGVSGGSNSEISFDFSAQEFTIHVADGDTSDFHGDVQLEIEINTNTSGNNQVKTIYKDFIRFNTTQINW